MSTQSWVQGQGCRGQPGQALSRMFPQHIRATVGPILVLLPPTPPPPFFPPILSQVFCLPLVCDLLSFAPLLSL